MPEARLNLPITRIAIFGKAPLRQNPATLDADVAILGAPWDKGTGFRPGARFGPRGIRTRQDAFQDSTRRWNLSQSGLFLSERCSARITRRALDAAPGAV